jgi:hypothetical protein
MKQLVAVTLLLLNFTAFAQKPCEYSTNVSDPIGDYKSTREYTDFEKNFAGNSEYIFFTSFNWWSTNSKCPLIQKQRLLKANCFDKNLNYFYN